jgi:hypothetical protein
MRNVFAKLKRFSHAIRNVVLGLLLITILSCVGCFPDTTINCWQDEVDIHTGRIRYSYFLLCVPVVRYVQDSALTRALSEEEQNSQVRQWRTVTRISPGKNYSPHYFYHGAIFQIKELEYTWDALRLTTPARRESARRVLKAWQQDGNYWKVQEYIYTLKGLEKNEATGFWEPKGRGGGKGVAAGPVDSGIGAKRESGK